MSGQVDLRRLKAWAAKHLSHGSKLREVIMLDKDQLTSEAFLAKMTVWLALYDLEHGSTNNKERRVE